MNLLKANSDNISKAADVIKNGGLVAFPTETVYGLGANGLDPIAAAKIFEAKNRPSFNPLILHIPSYDYIERICNIELARIEKVIKAFWPGPLTLVLPKKDIVPDIITAGHSTVAVRIPRHPVAKELIEKAQTPVAAPSANAFSQLSPTEAQHVVNQLGEKVDIILDGGNCKVGVESTIMQIEEDEFTLLRPGGLPVEEIENLLGIKLNRKIPINETPNSPGQLPFHYSPKIPLKIIGRFDETTLEGKKVGALFFKSKSIDFNFADERFLSKEGCLTEAAANLFAFLHDMEKEDLDLIIAEPFDEEGLGRAIMDRLNKAAKRFE